MGIHATRTNCRIVLGQAVEVDIRCWHHDLYTLTAVRTGGLASGTDFEHYGSFNAAQRHGVRVAKAMLLAM